MSNLAGHDAQSLRTVFILGAGASAPDGAPLIRQFKKTSEKVLKEATFPNQCRRKFQLAIDQWNETPKLNIEEYYELVDLRELLEPRESTDQLADSVRYLIGKTIAETSVRKPNSPYNQLATYIGSQNTRWQQESAIVSLNWDVMVENALAQLTNIQPSPGVSQGNDDWRGIRHQFRVMKLHGSLGWLHCSNPSCEKTGLLRIAPDKIGLQTYELDRPPNCPHCQRRLSPGVVPPRAAKLGRDEAKLLRDVWTCSKATLKRAKRLVIIGYSFPPADSQFRAHLVDALQDKMALEQIEVVTNRKSPNAVNSYRRKCEKVLAPLSERVPMKVSSIGFTKWVNKLLEDTLSSP